MRGVGRQCRGQGHVFVKWVRHTERRLLACGQPIRALGQHAQQRLAQAHERPDSPRARLLRERHVARGVQEQIRQPSRQLTPGKKRRPYKIVKAYDPPIAPILKGKSHCPAQCGRKPGRASAPATGFIFASRVPTGHPSDRSSVLPVLDTVPSAINRVKTPRPLQVQSVAGALGVNDTARRAALHARGILTVGIPTTVEPINPKPTAEESLAFLHEAGLDRQRTPHQVRLACACGSSRPVVESHIASVLSRGAGQVRANGLQGAVGHQGMTVMAHHGATLVRIGQQRLSTRAPKFRR